MTEPYKYPTEYFLQEGKENLRQCLEATFVAAVAHSIEKVIIFTSAGVGVRLALDEYTSQEQYSSIKVIAVTFPSHTKLPAGDPSEYCIQKDTSEYFAARDVPVVRAHLPFNPIHSHRREDGILGQDFSLISSALGIFCGSMSLCVQAVLMASDAGFLDFGEHVIAMTSDTSILARSAPTNRFLTDLIVREIICKPVLLTVGKSETAAPLLEESVEPLSISAPDATPSDLE